MEIESAKAKERSLKEVGEATKLPQLVAEAWPFSSDERSGGGTGATSASTGKSRDAVAAHVGLIELPNIIRCPRDAMPSLASVAFALFPSARRSSRCTADQSLRISAALSAISDTLGSFGLLIAIRLGHGLNPTSGGAPIVVSTTVLLELSLYRGRLRLGVLLDLLQSSQLFVRNVVACCKRTT